MNKYDLNIIVHIGYTDAGEPEPAKVVKEELGCESHDFAILAMSVKVHDARERFKDPRGVNIKATLTSESGRIVSVFNDF